MYLNIKKMTLSLYAARFCPFIYLLSIFTVLAKHFVEILTVCTSCRSNPWLSQILRFSKKKLDFQEILRC